MRPIFGRTKFISNSIRFIPKSPRLFDNLVNADEVS
jgi:hypothetical protein